MKKKTLLITSGLAVLTSMTALFAAVSQSNPTGLLMKANPTEYSITLTKNNKLETNRGIGTAYTGYENPIDFSYSRVDWDNDKYFVTLSRDGGGKFGNKTALSGIQRVTIVAKPDASTRPSFDIVFSIGEYLDNPSYNQTLDARKGNELPASASKTYTFEPNRSDFNYFTIIGSKTPLYNNSIFIESITITYSCSMTKAGLRVSNSYNFASVQITNKENREYSDFDINEVAQVNVNYDTDLYEFTGWRYKDNYDIINTNASFSYTVTNERGFHDLVPHFVKKDCIHVYSNHSSLGDASFSDGAVDKMAYTDTEYTVVATLVESDLEEGFFPVFDGWYLNGVRVSQSLTYTFTVPEAGVAYEMAARFGRYSETFNRGVRLCYQEYYLEHLWWREEKTDTFVKSYDGAYYDFESYVGTISGKGHCEEQSYNTNDLWHQHARGISALTPYLRLNKNYSQYYKADGQGGQTKVNVKDFDPNKIASIEFIFDMSEANLRDDIYVAGGASEFALTQKGIADPVDGKTVSKFYLTTFTTDEIKISLPDNLNNQQWYRLKRVTVHYKIADSRMEQ